MTVYRHRCEAAVETTDSYLYVAVTVKLEFGNVNINVNFCENKKKKREIIKQTLTIIRDLESKKLSQQYITKLSFSEMRKLFFPLLSLSYATLYLDLTKF